MIKKQMRTVGYKAIVKENKSHQEAFDEISKTKGVDRKVLADELSKIPSSGKQNATSTLRYIFIVSLVILAALRILGIVMLGMDGTLTPVLILVMVIVGVLVPVLGIYAALASKVEFYMTTGILLAISLFRSISRGELNAEPETLVGLIPFALAVALAFFIPTKLKTPHKRKVSEQFIDGKMIKKIDYVFEDTRMNPVDILDSEF